MPNCTMAIRNCLQQSETELAERSVFTTNGTCKSCCVMCKITFASHWMRAKTCKNLHTIISQDKCIKVYISVFAYQQHCVFKSFFNTISLLNGRVMPCCISTQYLIVFFSIDSLLFFPLQFCFSPPALPCFCSSSCICGSFIHSQGLHTPYGNMCTEIFQLVFNIIRNIYICYINKDIISCKPVICC